MIIWRMKGDIETNITGKSGRDKKGIVISYRLFDYCRDAFSRNLTFKDIETSFKTYMRYFGFQRGEMNIFCRETNTCFRLYFNSVLTSRKMADVTEDECFSFLKNRKEDSLLEEIRFEQYRIGYIYIEDVKLDELPENVAHGAVMSLSCLARMVIFYLLQKKFYEARSKYEVALKGPANILRQLSKMMHDIKTPLAAIMAAADLVQSEMMGALNDSQKKYLGMIKDSSRQLSVMLDDLMDLARIRLSAIELRIAPFSIKDVVNEVLNLFEGQILDKKLDVKTEFVGNEYVIADERRIKQVIYNLVSNSIKYTPSGGKITISVISEDDGFKVTVADTGPGLPEEIVESLLSDSGDESTLTTGMFIIKRLIEYHGGHIEIESAKGKGTKFSFFIPKEGHARKEDSQQTMETDTTEKSSDEDSQV